MEEPTNDLRRIRVLDKRISQFELSRRSGVHPTRISLFESGKKTPSLSEMDRISAALGMVPEEIFGLDTVMRRLTPGRKKEAE
jgi:transcriptional regulator with XRE-family HTH domain